MSAIRWQIYTADDPTVERIFPDLAAEIGLNESIVLMQIAHWIKISSNVVNDTYWTYQTLQEMKDKAFKYWSTDTIRRITHNLRDSGYILIDNHNQRKGDNTQWFALVPDKLSQLKSILVMPLDENPLPQKPPPPLQVASTPSQDRTTLPESLNTNTKDTSYLCSGYAAAVIAAHTKPAEKQTEPTVSGEALTVYTVPAPEPVLPFKKIVPISPVVGEVEVVEEKPAKVKKERKPRVRPEGVTPAECINPMKDAIVKAFNWDWKTMNKVELGTVYTTAKQLCEVNFPPSEVKGLYNFCAEKFEDFKPTALLNWQSEYRKLHKPASNPVPPPDKPFVPILMRLAQEQDAAEAARQAAS